MQAQPHALTTSPSNRLPLMLPQFRFIIYFIVFKHANNLFLIRIVLYLLLSSQTNPTVLNYSRFKSHWSKLPVIGVRMAKRSDNNAISQSSMKLRSSSNQMRGKWTKMGFKVMCLPVLQGNLSFRENKTRMPFAYPMRPKALSRSKHHSTWNVCSAECIFHSNVDAVRRCLSLPVCLFVICISMCVCLHVCDITQTQLSK